MLTRRHWLGGALGALGSVPLLARAAPPDDDPFAAFRLDEVDWSEPETVLRVDLPQLQYAGRWNPRPGAMRELASELRLRTRLEPLREPSTVTAGAPALFLGPDCDGLSGADGLVLEPGTGDILVPVNYKQRIIRIDAAKTITVLAEGGLPMLAPHLRDFLEEVTTRGSGDDIALGGLGNDTYVYGVTAPGGVPAAGQYFGNDPGNDKFDGGLGGTDTLVLGPEPVIGPQQIQLVSSTTGAERRCSGGR